MTFLRVTEKNKQIKATVTYQELEFTVGVSFAVRQIWIPCCLLHLVAMCLWTGTLTSQKSYGIGENNASLIGELVH
jgi:hypothetical protein